MPVNRIESELVSQLGFLAGLGFSDRTAVIEQSKLLGETTVLQYSSPLAGRQLSVTYFGGSEKYPRSLTVVVAAGKRSFLLSDYLKLKRMEDAAHAFVTSDINSNEVEFIKHATTVLRNLCERDLRLILLGKSWEQVPFDWKGTR